MTALAKSDPETHEESLSWGADDPVQVFHAESVDGYMLVCDRVTLTKGSWLCVCFDDRGRLVCVHGPNDGSGLPILPLLEDATWDMWVFEDGDVGPEYQDISKFGEELEADPESDE